MLTQDSDEILYLVKAGCSWRLLPKSFPPWKTVCDRFRKWCRDGTWLILNHTLAQTHSTLCGRGYVVFAARPGSKTRYTAAEMEHHVKLAIRYARAQAAGHGIDPERLGLTGASAGGHLATLAALAPEAGQPGARNPLDRHGTAVRAVGVFFPPTDFLDWSGDGRMADLGLLGPLLFGRLVR